MKCEVKRYLQYIKYKDINVYKCSRFFLQFTEWGSSLYTSMRRMHIVFIEIRNRSAPLLTSEEIYLN